MERRARLVDGRVVEIFESEVVLHPSVLAGAVPVPAESAVAEGWLWDGASFIPPPPPPPRPPIRTVRSLAFRLRLPTERRAAITAAAVAAVPKDGGAALTFLLDQASSVTTDLDDPRVAGGVAALAAAGVITSAEAAALLADGTIEEMQ